MIQTHNNPAIVVCAYNRPQALARLLASLSDATYTSDEITLVISVDKSDSEDVHELAENFNWKHGTKIVIRHTQHLGLKAHVLSCGDLAETYGSVIILEDDLFVSPCFYEYAQQAQATYQYQQQIAGISLYNYQFSESSFYPFAVMDDGADVYFMQVASSLGQLWTSQQWREFKSWLNTHAELPKGPEIPGYLQHWGPQSWKKHFTHYLIDTHKFVAFPRLSLTTHVEAQGTNTSANAMFSAPLQLFKKDYNFSSPETSGACYDAWFEILPACLDQYNSKLSAYDYAVDLHGTKPITALSCDYVLTSQKASSPLLSFGIDLLPFEMNVALGFKGAAIGFYQVKGNAFTPRPLTARNILAEQKKHDASGISVIIPLEKENTEAVKVTLQSIAIQDLENKECIVVSNDPLSAELKKIIYDSGLRVKVVRPAQPHTTEQLVGLGFEKANKGILTWVAPGNTFTAAALQQVHSVFSANLSVSWLRGIPETTGMFLNVRKYRLVAGEAYKRLKAGTLSVSMEQDFFRKHCIADTNAEFSLSELFFHCIQTYQLFILVSKLGVKTNERLLSSAERQKLLKTYAHLGEKNRPLIFLADRFLTLFFPNSGISQWFYPSMLGFPNVMRYDAVHGTFFMNRY